MAWKGNCGSFCSSEVTVRQWHHAEILWSRSGWSDEVNGRYWGAFELEKLVAQKEKMTERYNRRVRSVVHRIGDLTMLHQKSGGKMEERWRGPFRIRGYEDTHTISFTLEQLDERKIWNGLCLVPNIWLKIWIDSIRLARVLESQGTILIEEF